MSDLKIEKKYISIEEVSKLLNIKKHVLRYWDSKFDGISSRLHQNKQRFFTIENINKIKKIQKILYQNGRHMYSLDLAEKLIETNPDNCVVNKKIITLNKENETVNISKLKKIRDSLKKISKF